MRLIQTTPLCPHVVHPPRLNARRHTTKSTTAHGDTVLEGIEPRWSMRLGRELTRATVPPSSEAPRRGVKCPGRGRRSCSTPANRSTSPHGLRAMTFSEHREAEAGRRPVCSREDRDTETAAAAQLARPSSARGVSATRTRSRRQRSGSASCVPVHGLLSLLSRASGLPHVHSKALPCRRPSHRPTAGLLRQAGEATVVQGAAAVQAAARLIPVVAAASPRLRWLRLRGRRSRRRARALGVFLGCRSFTLLHVLLLFFLA